MVKKNAIFIEITVILSNVYENRMNKQ